MGGTKANMQKQKIRDRPFKHHSQPRRCRNMLLSHIEICFQGSVCAFPDFSSFAARVNSIQGASKVISIRGIGAKHGHGNPLLSHFVTLDLHLAAASHWIFAETMWTSSSGGGSSDKNRGESARNESKF